MLQPIRDQSQGQRLNGGRCLLPCPSICGYAGQGSDVRQPTAIFFPEILDAQRKAGLRFRHTFIIPPNRAWSERLRVSPSRTAQPRYNRRELMALAAGTRLGCYEILAPLGAGGLGEVYRAKDLKLDREVAIKFMPTPSPAHSLPAHKIKRDVGMIP